MTRAGMELDPYDMRILVRALFTSGLTDDMNSVDRRKTAIRLRDSLKEQSEALAASPDPEGPSDDVAG